MNARAAKDPLTVIKEASSNTRVLGSVLIVIGLLPLVAMMMESRDITLSAQLFCFSDTLILIGPGAWYCMAGYLIQRRHPTVARTSFRIAVVQLMLVVTVLLIGLVLDQAPSYLFLPAVLNAFFIPALLALLYNLAIAQRALILYGNTARAFETVTAVPVQRAVPVTDPENDHAPPPTR
jgi:hypothetical protein